MTELTQTQITERPLKRLMKSSQLYLLLALPLAWLILFRYVPVYGVQIAFKRFSAFRGIWGSPWVGLLQFERFFQSYMFWRVIRNTLGISLYQLLAGFPVPIILALLLNSSVRRKYSKSVQMITYLPHFISTVVMVGIILQFLHPRIGVLNNLLGLVGLELGDVMARPRWFKSIYVWSGVWQNAGWGTIIYLATLAGIAPELHEAAIMDGANRLQRVRWIDFPGLLPTAVILLILNTGRMMDVGFEKVFLMQNDLNLSSSEIISTYVYKVGLGSGTADFSYATAIGLFRSVINLVLIVSVNRIARRLGETSLW